MSSKTVRTKPCFCDSFLAGISRAGGTVGYKALHGITMHYSVPYTKHFQDGKVNMWKANCLWIADEIWTPQVHPSPHDSHDNIMTTPWQPFIIHHCIIASLHLHVWFREVIMPNVDWCSILFGQLNITRHTQPCAKMIQCSQSSSFIAKLWIEKPDVIYYYLLYEMKTSFN